MRYDVSASPFKKDPYFISPASRRSIVGSLIRDTNNAAELSFGFQPLRVIYFAFAVYFCWALRLLSSTHFP